MGRLPCNFIASAFWIRERPFGTEEVLAPLIARFISPTSPLNRRTLLPERLTTKAMVLMVLMVLVLLAASADAGAEAELVPAAGRAALAGPAFLVAEPADAAGRVAVPIEFGNAAKGM